MIKSYLKIALRNLKIHKAYSFINIFGLAIGMTCCIFIALYVQDELSYDRYHEKAARIFRLVPDLETDSEPRLLAQGSPPMAPFIKAEFPEVVDVVRFFKTSGLFQYQDKQFQEDAVYYTDASIFNIFSFELIKGNPATALNAPNSLAVSEKVAQRYFGDEDPMNKLLIKENGDAFMVTGVFKDLPSNSHFTFDMLVSWATFEVVYSEHVDSWGAFFVPTYLLLAESTDITKLLAKLPQFLDRHINPDWSVKLDLQLLTDIYLFSHRRGEHGARGNVSLLYILAGVAVFILLIASVNFMNLATARSISRAKEVGIRKVVGARRQQLIGQFMGEALFMSFIALFLAIGISLVLLPLFTDLTGKMLSFDYNNYGVSVALLLGFAAVVGMIAGSYPALVLSGFKVTKVLKGAFKSSGHGKILRRGLVILQFVISFILIVGTTVVYKQLHYIRNENLGFDKEQILVIDFRGDPQVRKSAVTIKEAFLSHPAITKSSNSSRVPGTGATFVALEINSNGETLEGIFAYYDIDFDFIENYGLEVVAGRPLLKEFATDSSEAVLINESAVAYCGWTSSEDAIGKSLIAGNGPRKIVGVVKDFNYSSLHQGVEPMFLQIGAGRYLSLRLNSKRLTQVMPELERIWENQVPHRPFNFIFLDQQLDLQYRAEKRFGTVIGMFAILATFIASLGLFGLASFSTEQRAKEIGVRKVLGASISQIVILLSKEIITLVVIALLVASPIAFFTSRGWLQNFAYRTEIGIGMFLLAGLLTLIIAWLTVSLQATKAALTNTAEVLKYE
jgi:putative ABC transport system permease protein